MKKNPRAVLAGHGIPAIVLQTIIARPDVMSKLATILYSTVYAKKGAAGLKKAPNFKISGYKNYATFNVEAREDVEKFVGGLSTDDASKFTNADNILTIVLLPDSFTEGDDTTAQEIISGKSVALSFDSSVRKEYKINGGMYLTIMVGDSAARPAEVVIAARKEKVNKVKQSRRTPAKIVAELKSKANKKLLALKKKRKDLEQLASKTERQLSQFANVGKQFGVKGGNPISVIGGINKFNKNIDEINQIVAGLSAEDKTYFNSALKALKVGTPQALKLAKLNVKAIGNPILTEYILAGAPTNADTVIGDRKTEVKNELKNLVGRNDELLAMLGDELDPKKKLSLRSMISKNNSKIKELRAKLGTYKNISVTGMKKKAQLLKEVHAAIEANIAQGETINQALNNALAAINAKASEKQLIKQQVVQQVANGTPMQYAVQQAIQDNIQEAPVQELGTSALSDNLEIQELLASL
jgi:hypothetical protein